MLSEDKIKELVKWLKENRNNEGYSDYSYSEGRKWWKIISENGGSKSVHSFVAKVDNYSKPLGFVKEGDIHKAASWASPAKTARGSIFTPDDWAKTFGRYGAVYLK